MISAPLRVELRGACIMARAAPRACATQRRGEPAHSPPTAGHGATASSTIVYEIELGGRLGWHTDATEETQYILAGTGELRLEHGGKHKVGPGRVFVMPRRYGTIWPIPAARRCAPWPSSRRPCSRSSSTT